MTFLGNTNFCGADLAVVARKVAKRYRKMELKAIYVDEEDGEESYLIDAPVSVGDGFSFTGGKYSDEKGPADLWEEKGKYILAFSQEKKTGKAKDPLFGLAMAESSQVAGDKFQWFYVEEGDPSNPTVLLLHGLPSQSYSFRKVLPELSKDFRVLAPDWLGFGFSDKPQPNYGFSYSLSEFSEALSSLVEELGLSKFSIVTQGYFAPAVVSYAAANQERVERIVLINPPLTDEHSKLPSSLSSFAGFLLGEIFAQDPLRASDKLLASCQQYQLAEEDAMVYRSMYLSSGMAGFALTAVTRALQKNLKDSLIKMREELKSTNWVRSPAIIWGKKDRWLSFSGVSEFAKETKITLRELQEVGHHAQEDYGEEVGSTLCSILRKTT